MQLRIDLSAGEWRATLEELDSSSRDVYFTPEYHAMHEANGDGKPFAAKAYEGAQTLLICGLRTEVPNGVTASGMPAWDLQTCNGYGGPVVSNSVSEDFLRRAWLALVRECEAAGMVAAFFRLHPVLENRALLPNTAELRLDRQTVWIDLSGGIESAWAAADTRHRNMVSKGERHGVRVLWNDRESWTRFVKLYRTAMQRLAAPERLHFSDPYFERLCALSETQLASIYGVDGELDAASVFLFGEVYAHYHLSARRPEAGNHLTNCILQSAIERAAEAGVRGLHLGGGRTVERNDSLLKFKQAAGGRLLDFHVALVKPEHGLFDRLCEEWAEIAQRRPSWLLGYRQPIPQPMSNER